MSVEITSLDINDKRLQLQNDEKVVFADMADSGRCCVYRTVSGKYEPEFPSSQKRSNTLQRFLAFWSEELGTHQMEDQTQNSFLYLTFNSDREIFKASKEPSEYKSKIVWRYVKSVEKTDSVYKYLSSYKFEPTVITMILKVNRLDSDEVMFVNSYKFEPFRLFVNVLLPWKLPVKLDKDGNEIKTVTTNLSMYQSKLFLDEKNRCTFYPTNDPKVFEPYITSNNARNNIIYEIISIMADRGIFRSEKDVQNKDKIITLRFRDGDRELANSLLNMNSNRFWSFEDLATFDDPVKVNLIKSQFELAKKNDNGENVFLVEFYVPNTDEVYIYTSFAKKIPEPRKH